MFNSTEWWTIWIMVPTVKLTRVFFNESVGFVAFRFFYIEIAQMLKFLELNMLRRWAFFYIFVVAFRVILCIVKRLYCKRPIQCLASSKILTTHPLTARRVCITIPPPLPLVRGKDTLAGSRGGWGVKILEDARHSSVLYICKYFVLCIFYVYSAYSAYANYAESKTLLVSKKAVLQNYWVYM